MPINTSDAFRGIDSLYGDRAYQRLSTKRVYVVGVGGVGSWVVESLARSGIGEIRLADLDDICVTNTNRQIHALSSTIGQSKIDVMAERCRSINPEIIISCDHAFVTDKTVNSLIDSDLDLVIDCGDNQMAKAALISHCKRMKVPVITTGAAGGRIDPSKVQVRDLAKTDGDALLASVRQTLRNRYGFSRTPGKRFSVSAVYSDEQTRYLQADGSVGQQKPAAGANRLDCVGSLGAATHVTAVFAFHATAKAIDILLN
ncbi:MAG: tRNA threonylcarbamoyladenosine dehydratase [Pseudomonadota bacterium]|nr:tRNA threonylcarbamoyladenosine dehydratase [Pseudomonadota bacterium]